MKSNATMQHVLEEEANVKLEASYYTPQGGGRREMHLVMTPTRVAGGFSEVLEKMRGVLSEIINSPSTYRPVFVRAFLSDVTNQAEEVEKVFSDLNCALSIIGQPPLSRGVKISMLVIMAEDVEVSPAGEFSYAVSRGNYTDLWSTVPSRPGEDSYSATKVIFLQLASALSQKQMSVADNCLRTWFYVRDIDNRYRGMVIARNEFFASCGLTSDTHFIASTGIEGDNRLPNAVVTLDALSVNGLQPDQVRYISAPTHLNPTADYGVAFERATAIEYGDRRHVIISGTASINNKGEIVAPGDVAAQCVRMADNVDALLEQAGVSPKDLAHIVLYLRDIADSTEARNYISLRYPGVPCVVVKAAVCRPGWLVEMECMAIADANNPDYAAY